MNTTSAPYPVPTVLVAYALTCRVELDVIPEMLLVKLAEPAPSLVFESAMVGFAVALQHTPLADIATPPSERTTPPHAAEIIVIEEMAVVVKVGAPVGTVNVVNGISSPYAVPLELVAYALT